MLQTETPTKHLDDLHGTAVEFSGHMAEGCKNAFEAADAQIAIWSIKTMRAVVLTSFCIAGIVLTTMIALYALFLLDQSFAYALNASQMPFWFSPLVRGVVYLAISGGGLMFVFHRTVGFSSAKK
jgi:hypothetical protein